MPVEPEPDNPEPGGPSPQGSNSTGLYGLVGIGFEFLATIVVFGAIGWYADRHFNSFPWLTIVGGAAGFAGGLVMMIRAAKNAFRD